MQIPSLWGEVLGAIQVHAPEAFIGGGALRDLYLGRPIKDVDLFMSADNGDSFDRGALMARFGYEGSTYVNLDYADGGDAAMVDAWTFEKPGETEFNLIRLRSDYELPSALFRFDLGLCQIGWGGQRIETTDHFLVDSLTETMTVARCQSADQMTRTKARHERLRQKYVGWPLVIPEQFQPFAV